MKTRLQVSILLLAASLLLTACAAPAAAPTADVITDPTATEVMPTAEAATDPAPTAEIPTAAPTEAPTEAQPAAGNGVRTYVIVPERSKVSYSVGEVFFNENNRFNLAVGITQQVNGEVYLDFGAPDKSSIGVITVDISTFTSDSGRRDNAIRTRWLESQRYPIATFTPKSVTGIPAAYQDGSEVELQVSGDLTVREVSQPVTFVVKAKLNGEELTGSANTEILMSNFGFSPPDIAGMLKAEDKVVIDFEFVAVPK